MDFCNTINPPIFMLHKVGLRKGQLTNMALWSSEFLSTDFVSMFFHMLWFYHILIITSGTSPNRKPNATRLCKTLEADSCVNQWFASNPNGDKCPKYLFNICELWQNSIPFHPNKASQSPHPTRYRSWLEYGIKYGPDWSLWSQDSAWILWVL